MRREKRSNESCRSLGVAVERHPHAEMPLWTLPTKKLTGSANLEGWDRGEDEELQTGSRPGRVFSHDWRICEGWTSKFSAAAAAMVRTESRIASVRGCSRQGALFRIEAAAVPSKSAAAGEQVPSRCTSDACFGLDSWIHLVPLCTRVCTRLYVQRSRVHLDSLGKTTQVCVCFCLELCAQHKRMISANSTQARIQASHVSLLLQQRNDQLERGVAGLKQIVLPDNAQHRSMLVPCKPFLMTQKHWDGCLLAPPRTPRAVELQLEGIMDGLTMSPAELHLQEAAVPVHDAVHFLVGQIRGPGRRKTCIGQESRWYDIKKNDADCLHI